MTLHDWQTTLQDVMPSVLAWRRHLHQHPERSGHEENTQRFIADRLTEMGIPVRTFEGCHAVMGVLDNGEGRCIAIRADMDALPVTEADEGCPFRSENPGIMHACGHDVHMALALGSAMWLSQNRDRWRGTVKWLFEPQEETVGGGKWMVQQGCMENPTVNCVIGQHVNPRYPAGTFFAKAGFVSGASDDLHLTVRGRSCHGAYPESGVDAILIAAQIITALQSLVSRTISPFDPAVLTLGTIEGGQANNIVCGEVRIRGTLRTLSDRTRREMQTRMQQVAGGIAAAMGGEAVWDIRPSYGAVYNDDGYYGRIERCAAELLGEERIVRRETPSLGVESFCYFLDHTPGVYYDIGSGVGTALHTPTFHVDEAVLLPGVALQCASVLALLNQ